MHWLLGCSSQKIDCLQSQTLQFKSLPLPFLQVRCCGYWPDVKSSLEYGKYEVFNLSEQKDRISITRQLRLRNNMVSRARRMRIKKKEKVAIECCSKVAIVDTLGT